MRSDVEVVPPVVFGYGLLGLLPFVAPPVVSLILPNAIGDLAMLQAVYAALILSFLGGARWAFEVARSEPRFAVVSLAMLPSIAALALLMLPETQRALQLSALGGLLLVHFVWDARAANLPDWYPRLRMILTLGASASLGAQAAIIAV